MEATLKLGNFQELTHDELMLVDGGNWSNFWQATTGTLLIAGGVVTASLAVLPGIGPGAVWLGTTMVGTGMFQIGSLAR
ncbi:MAG: hypothetical protein FWF57_00060 [Defluviitaleaceae bacterium]|nr:hypothetical protein [Defluviitaleaceae bacterium]